MFDYTLHIDAYSPATIPMARLAEYMGAFANLLGHKDSVHFDRLEPGSTRLRAVVEKEAVPKVGRDLREIANGNGVGDQKKAWQILDRMMADDNASGRLIAGDGLDNGEVISFPGASAPRPQTFGPFNQRGSLQGILVSIGGADASVHLRLQNGDVRYSGIDCDRATARELAKHLFEPVRVNGTGRWFRNLEGEWELRNFKVADFEVLQKGTLRDAIEELRGLEGDEWSEVDDPVAEVIHLRLDNG